MKRMDIAKSLAIALSALIAFLICGLAFKEEILTRAEGIADCVIELLGGSEGEKVLVVSSHIPNAEALARAAADGVTVVRYDAQKTSPSTLLAMIREKISDHPIRRLALAVESQGQNAFNLTAGVTVSLGSILVNEVQKDFFRGLGKLISEDGRIDILACDCAAGEYGSMVIDALEELTGVKVAASTNATGNSGQGGDWVLETSLSDAGECYFNSERLRLYAGLLTNPSMVAEIVPGSDGGSPSRITSVNGMLYFMAYDDVNGYELWKSDCTEAGTVMVKDIYAGNGSSSPNYLTNVNGTLYFTADNGTNGVELWQSDGTEAGTVMVKDIYLGGSSSSPNYLTNVNGTLYFSADSYPSGFELWKSDGTEAGTVVVTDMPGVINNFLYLTNVNGTLYFSANNGTNGFELWKSDGTSAGTVMVKDINVGNHSSPTYLTNVNGTLYFAANSSSTWGVEFWKSDGTEVGTVLVKDIYPGGSSSPMGFTNVNGNLYFSATDYSHGRELWKSDGTEAGTVMVKDIFPAVFNSNPAYLTNVNGMLYFVADNGTWGIELWKSDGTTAGTVMVKDINPGYMTSYLSNLTHMNGTLYFVANDGTNGGELWESDGTEAGTVMVKDIYPGGGSSSIDSLVTVNGTLYFDANDGTHGRELWKYEAPPELEGPYHEITPPDSMLLFSTVGGRDSALVTITKLWGSGVDTLRIDSLIFTSTHTPVAGDFGLSDSLGIPFESGGIVRDTLIDSLSVSRYYVTFAPGTHGLKKDSLVVYGRRLMTTGTYEIFADFIKIMGEAVDIDVIRVYAPDTVVTASEATMGDTISIPVYMDRIVYGNHNGIRSFQFSLNYNDSLFHYVGIDTAGSIANNYGMLSPFIIEERSEIGIGPPIFSERDCVYVAGACDDTLYYPDVPGTAFGYPRILARLLFEVGSTETDSSKLLFGTVLFNEGIPQTVSQDGIIRLVRNLYGDVDRDGQIVPYDAVLVLRYVIKDTTLNAISQTAAEVSGNGQITAYDAALILMHYVGKITTFPVGAYFKQALPSNRGAELALEWGEMKDGMLTLLVNAKNLAELYGYSMELAYDPAALVFQGAGLTDFTQGMISVVKPEEGVIRFAAAGSEPIEGDGALARLTFRATGEISGKDIIQLTELILNEELVLSNASSVSIPKTYVLEQNYPNPFNPTTHIRYQIPEAAQVSITIYNLLGQRVRTLVNEARSAGAYDILWDGTNDNGVKLASGVYIYRMQAGNFTQIRKLALLK